MAKFTIQTEPQESPANIIFVNHTILNKLKLPSDRTFHVVFGNKKVKVRYVSFSNKSSLIRFPANVANELLLPNGIQLNGKYMEKEEQLLLGPILGILVQNIQEKQTKSPFGKFTPYAQEVSQKAFSKGVFPYLFSIQDVDLENGTINGRFLKNSKWHKQKFPIPNVIYNRISSRRYERKIMPELLELKQKYEFNFFNDQFLNKWDVYQMLRPTPIRKIIPKTIIYRGYKSIREMLNSYPVIYIKPTNGSLGIGIIRVEKKANVFEARHTRAQGQTNLVFTSQNKLLKYIAPRIRKRQYLVQQGLDLISLNRRPIDFRILVQKNPQGKWSITSMVARIANDQHFVSNLAQGGTQGNVYQTIKLASPELAKKYSRKEFSTNALSIAKSIEDTTKGSFAELGIDFALDKNGKLWLLEVNSKPSKIDDQKDPKETRPSVTKLINYVIYLTGMGTKTTTTNPKKKQRSG